MLTIKYLKFYKGCKYLKNLKTGVEYSLEHKLVLTSLARISVLRRLWERTDQEGPQRMIYLNI